MIQFKFLSGKKAGGSWNSRRFPVRIGRGPRDDLKIEEQGVWEGHLEVGLAPAEGFIAVAHSGALTAINGHPVERAALRNGDVIELGSVKLQFWLADTRQTGLLLREWLTWVGIGAICLGQVWLIYRMLS